MKILYALGAVILVGAVLAAVIIDIKTAPVHARTAEFHVIIDAGHGGWDGGAVSRNGTAERDINLAIARQLARELTSRGVGVTMTRTNQHSLANPYARNKKRSDMDARRRIIERVSPDLVISIHLNSFPQNPSVRGLQTFYDSSGETSKAYAYAIQERFNRSNLNTNRQPKSADYYILECTSYPSVLVECGFLSNPSDEKLLRSPDYQKLLAIMIAEAITQERLAQNKAD